jgi:hypothetical protein
MPGKQRRLGVASSSNHSAWDKKMRRANINSGACEKVQEGGVTRSPFAQCRLHCVTVRSDRSEKKFKSKKRGSARQGTEDFPRLRNFKPENVSGLLLQARRETCYPLTSNRSDTPRATKEVLREKRGNKRKLERKRKKTTMKKV